VVFLSRRGRLGHSLRVDHRVELLQELREGSVVVRERGLDDAEVRVHQDKGVDSQARPDHALDLDVPELAEPDH
jgi:hypothetical protein